MVNITIYPVLVTWKKGKKDNLVPLALCVMVDNKRVALVSLKRKILEDHWDVEARKVKKNCPNADLINKLIERTKNNLDEELLKKQLFGIQLTNAAIKDIAQGNSSVDFYTFCITEVKTRDYATGTVRLYESEINKLRRFEPVLNFRDIDLDFIKRYETYMRNTLKNCNNTIWKTTKFLNTFLNFAVGKHITDNPMREHQRTKYKQTIPDYCEWSEVLAIKEAVISERPMPEKMRISGYCFLLSCYSGLRFGDVTRFNYKKFVQEDSTGKRLLLNTQKTGELVSISFTKDIETVVDYLKDKVTENKNQDYNEEITMIGILAGIGKRLKSHMGRHSFGMRCAELGMREEDVMRLMGHSDTTYTRIYFRIKNKRLDDAMKVWDS